MEVIQSKKAPRIYPQKRNWSCFDQDNLIAAMKEREFVESWGDNRAVITNLNRDMIKFVDRVMKKSR